MPTVQQFEPEARAEYHAAIRSYGTEAEQAGVAARFVAAVESALVTVCAAPEMWRVVEPPSLRRYVSDISLSYLITSINPPRTW